MLRELHWELVAGTKDDFKDRLDEALTGARRQGFTEPLHVSHNIAMVGGTAPLISALVVLGKEGE